MCFSFQNWISPHKNNIKTGSSKYLQSTALPKISSVQCWI